ncbi:putative phosphoenolpyruvate synthase [Blattamonas nauphoetae]|uniref:Phosphoenolpyruvate synthase n=1 Tax=Blattamonas nauphoetae TaxID=2049346 RepID=A0ABQ9WXZ5_9EUKA|nr:putative phosphoenolpyruvate synthase [Blattamonas nauphoetae]
MESLHDFIKELVWSTPIGWNMIGHADAEGSPDNLMSFQITQVLLLASPYELFLMEDEVDPSMPSPSGNAEVVIQSSPFITRVSTLAQAEEAVKKRHFDMIVTLSQFNDDGMIKTVSTLRQLAGPSVPLFPLCTTLLPEVTSFPPPATGNQPKQDPNVSSVLPSSSPPLLSSPFDVQSTNSPVPSFPPHAHLESHQPASQQTPSNPLRPYLAHTPEIGPLAIPSVWKWNGSALIFSTLMKMVEDAHNVQDDVTLGSSVIVYVEHNPTFYSFLIPYIYQLLEKRDQPPPSRQAEISTQHSVFTQAARPKIIHCYTFEEAVSVILQYRHAILGLICDKHIVCSNPANARDPPPHDTSTFPLHSMHPMRFGGGFELRQLLKGLGSSLFLTSDNQPPMSPFPYDRYLLPPRRSTPSTPSSGKRMLNGSQQLVGGGQPVGSPTLGYYPLPSSSPGLTPTQSVPSTKPLFSLPSYTPTIHWLSKRSQHLKTYVSRFLLVHCGLGPFVFCDPMTRVMLESAYTMDDLFTQIQKMPADCVRFHSVRNDFSKWLFAHGEGGLSLILRSFNAESKEFEAPTAAERSKKMWEFLQSAYAIYRTRHTMGIARPFSQSILDTESSFFIKVGSGSLGGKARGLLFLERLLAIRRHHFAGYNVRLPKTLVLASGCFEEFVGDNELWVLVGERKTRRAREDDEGEKRMRNEISMVTDEEIASRFLAGTMSPTLVEQIRAFMLSLHTPIAVRSSGLLEDSRHQPLAGIYATHMVPNSVHAEEEFRLEQLVSAIKLVWASTFFRNARDYLSVVGLSPSDERMSVVLQEVIGQPHNEKRFYPDVSGVVQSVNFYAIEGMKPSDGLCTIALGLGKTVVDGGSCYRFSLGRPEVSYLFGVQDYMQKTQKEFFAVDVEGKGVIPSIDEGINLQKCKLDLAEEDGTLSMIGSVYDMEDGRINDFISGDPYRCPRLVTFSRLLKMAGKITNAAQINEFSTSLSNLTVSQSTNCVATPHASFSICNQHDVEKTINELNTSARAVWNGDGASLPNTSQASIPPIQKADFARFKQARSKSYTLPLPSILTSVMKIAEWGMAGPVEMEFAANLSTSPAELVLLQLRPMLGPGGGSDSEQIKKIIDTADSRVVCARSSTALGNGVVEGIREIVFVKRDKFDKMKTVEIAAEFAKLNRQFISHNNTPYVAIGVGRWGTSSPTLGIPLDWPQICGARVLIETGFSDFHIEPSLGTHFMHNVMGLRIPFLFIPPSDARGATKNECLDWDWLESLPVMEEGEFVRWSRVEGGVGVMVDGETRRGLVVKQEGGVGVFGMTNQFTEDKEQSEEDDSCGDVDQFSFGDVHEIMERDSESPMNDLSSLDESEMLQDRPHLGTGPLSFGGERDMQGASQADSFNLIGQTFQRPTLNTTSFLFMSNSDPNDPFALSNFIKDE